VRTLRAISGLDALTKACNQIATHLRCLCLVHLNLTVPLNTTIVGQHSQFQMHPRFRALTNVSHLIMEACMCVLHALTVLMQELAALVATKHALQPQQKAEEAAPAEASLMVTSEIIIVCGCRVGLINNSASMQK
jgi:hypothetical protein